MKNYTREDELQWSEFFNSKLDYAENNFLKDWFCFNHRTEVTYTHWIKYPKREERIIPINFKLFVYNLRLYKRNEFLAYQNPNRTIRRFISKAKAFQDELSPIIGYDYSTFIGDSVKDFFNSFNSAFSSVTQCLSVFRPQIAQIIDDNKKLAALKAYAEAA